MNEWHTGDKEMMLCLCGLMRIRNTAQCQSDRTSLAILYIAAAAEYHNSGASSYCVYVCMQQMKGLRLWICKWQRMIHIALDYCYDCVVRLDDIIISLHLKRVKKLQWVFFCMHRTVCLLRRFHTFFERLHLQWILLWRLDERSHSASYQYRLAT